MRFYFSGGNLVTISGVGFSDLTTINAGGRSCLIKSREDEEIVCIMPEVVSV